MADDDLREFTKDSPPHPNEGAWFRSRELVHAAFMPAGAKVGGKKHDGPGYVVIDDALENKDGKVHWVDADEFNSKFAAAQQGDMPYNPGPHFDAHEASKEQAEGYQMDPNVEGDRQAGDDLQRGLRG